MLAATPRVMSHFNDYANALHQKAEAEWLNFLLGFAAPPEIQNNVATPQNTQQPAVCTKSSSKEIERTNIKPATDSKATRRSVVSKKLSFAYSLMDILSASTDSSKESAPDGFRLVRKARERVIHPLALPLEPVAATGNGRAKSEYLWTLTQSKLGGRSKAARALVRELQGLIGAKTRSGDAAPVSFEKEVDQPSEPEPCVANQETNSSHVSSDESMR